MFGLVCKSRQWCVCWATSFQFKLLKDFVNISCLMKLKSIFIQFFYFNSQIIYKRILIYQDKSLVHLLCCTRQSLRRMVCSVLLVHVDRTRAPTLSTSLTGSSKMKTRVLHKHPRLSPSMRIPKRVSVRLEAAAPNLNRGLTRITATSHHDPGTRSAPHN